MKRLEINTEEDETKNLLYVEMLKYFQTLKKTRRLNCTRFERTQLEYNGSIER